MPAFWRRYRRRLRGLARMSWNDRALAAESFIMLATARLLVKTGRQANLASRMGGRASNVAPSAGEESSAAVTATGGLSGGRARFDGVRAGFMVERVARCTWWRSMCLEKALAGKWMLRRRGIPSTMYVGMARRRDGFVAHAWLVGQGQTITGAGETVYATLAAFREPADKSV